MESTERKRPVSTQSEYRRTAAHPHYRRAVSAPPRRDIREKILLQIIISGALFLIVLVVNMIDIEPVGGFKTSLKTALTESVSTEELSEQLKGVGRYVTSVQNTVLTIFGNEPKKENAAEAIPLPAAEEESTEEDQGTNTSDLKASGTDESETEESRGVDFRLDEDLFGISENESAEESIQEKKQ